MNQQKKFQATPSKKVSHSRQTKSMFDLPRYGPPPFQPFRIQPTLGVNLKKTPRGLCKKNRKFLFQRQQRLQSSVNLAMKAGDLNLFRRFKKINYLKNSISRKAVYNICEEKTISRLHENLQRIKLEMRESGRPLKFASFSG